METSVKRNPCQGVWNVIRFNWHFYVLSVCMIVTPLAFIPWLNPPLLWLAGLAALFASVMTLASLLASFYVYDLSGFYDLKWVDDGGKTDDILNVIAGFDETSGIVSAKYDHSTHHVMDFYHSLEKKEISIQRAQKAYPLHPNTQEIDLKSIPLPESSIDKAFAIFAAHEIRNDRDRLQFFKELNRVTKSHGKVYVAEHMRDVPNFIAYNIGYLHFLPRATWLKTFQQSGWHIQQTIKHTAFVSIFVLEKAHGSPS